MSARQNTAGSSYKPAVMWFFTVGFSPAPIIFFIFKLITGSEGTSLPVLTNPAVMMPVVMCKSGVVFACSYFVNLSIYLYLYDKEAKFPILFFCPFVLVRPSLTTSIHDLFILDGSHDQGPELNKAEVVTDVFLSCSCPIPSRLPEFGVESEAS